jgi:2,4-dienoyl-CoA reductase-like NADH-dependent reductase (Old Yellow Enzyme family)
VFVRISATEWVDGGWDIQQSIELARQVKELGVDLIDCSSGGNVAQAKIPAGPGYQTPFAERIRRESGVMTGALGMITSAVQAEHILATGQADAVIIAREILRDPYWSLRAARELVTDLVMAGRRRLDRVSSENAYSLLLKTVGTIRLLNKRELSL